MNTALTPMESEVLSYEDSFNAVNAYKLNFKKEANFALQLLKANDFLRGVAQKNPDSLKSAITNIAAIGLSLNTASKQVYLVPRGGAIYADVSYIGLADLATKEGHLLWVQAEIVKKNDEFKMQGLGKAPLHNFDPFGNRGEIVGVYCVAKTTTGEFLSTVMTKLECDQIREKCSKGSTSWKDFYEEMLKKTAIKRASKLWPKSERLETAINVINEHEGIEFERGPMISKQHQSAPIPGDNDVAIVKEMLASAGKTEAALHASLKPQFKDLPESISDYSGPQLAVAKDRLSNLLKSLSEATI